MQQKLLDRLCHCVHGCRSEYKFSAQLETQYHIGQNAFFDITILVHVIYSDTSIVPSSLINSLSSLHQYLSTVPS